MNDKYLIFGTTTVIGCLRNSFSFFPFPPLFQRNKPIGASPGREQRTIERVVERPTLTIGVDYLNEIVFRFCGWWLELFGAKLYMWAISYCRF